MVVFLMKEAAYFPPKARMTDCYYLFPLCSTKSILMLFDRRTIFILDIQPAKACSVTNN